MNEGKQQITKLLNEKGEMTTEVEEKKNNSRKLL